MKFLLPSAGVLMTTQWVFIFLNFLSNNFIWSFINFLNNNTIIDAKLPPNECPVKIISNCSLVSDNIEFPNILIIIGNNSLKIDTDSS